MSGSSASIAKASQRPSFSVSVTVDEEGDAGVAEAEGGDGWFGGSIGWT
jgi:hypothetical protein